MNWLVLYIKSGQELKTKEFLKKQGFDAFVPMKEKYFSKQGKRWIENKVLFPSYLFVRTNLSQNEFQLYLYNIKQINSSIYRQLIVDNEETSALYPEEIKVLERLLDVDDLIKNSIGIIEGDKVIILDGPLMGFESMIKKINRHKREALLEVDILGSKRNVTVSLEIIKKTI